MGIPSVLDFAHELAARTLEAGDVAVDATVGNGRDTVALARQVGATGRVVGFDVQAEAIDETRRRTEADVPEVDVRLIRGGHESMTSHVRDDVIGTVGAVMFNLGYLPGSDHSITTEPGTTRRALHSACDLLRPGGIITIVAYTGHEGGREEAEAVAEWTRTRPQGDFRVLSYEFVNQTNDPPRLYAVEKQSGTE